MKRRKRVSRAIPAKGRLRDMADALWSVAVRTDWNYRCAVCGRGKTDSHHLIPRQHEAYRYDLRNGIALCPKHHKFDWNLSPHQNAAGWIRWLRDHQSDLHSWYMAHTETIVAQFMGITNAAYFCETIQGLREYVPEAEFRRICGQRFSGWLDEQ